MTRKGTKSGPLVAAAGAKNLAKWKAEHPQGGGTTHGAYSKHVRKRYSDYRTREGKQLRAVMNGLVDDLGGHSEISASQRLLLDGIRSKMIVTLQIGKYADAQDSIITDGGELLPVLGKNFTAYSESLRRDLQSLHDMALKKPARIPTIEDIINEK